MLAWTNKARYEIRNQTINFETDTIKVALLSDAYIPGAGAVNIKRSVSFMSDIVANEVSVTGYSRLTMASKSITLDNTNNLINFLAANLTYNITGTLAFRYLVIFKDTGSDATSVVLAVLDKGALQTRTNTTVNVTFTNGIALQIDNNLITSFWTNYAIQQMAKQTINWNTDTIKVMLLTAPYTLDTKKGVDFLNDVTSFETVATGYTRVTLGTKSIVNNNSVDTVEFKAASFTWTITGSINFRYAVIFKDTGNAATSIVLAIIDKGSDQVKTNTDVTISEVSNIWLTSVNS